MSEDEEKSRHEPDDEDEPRGPPRGVAVGAYGLAIFLACRLLEIFLEAQATASAVGQAVLVEWASSRLGVVWSDPRREQTRTEVAKRAGQGLAIGVGAALAVVAVLFGSHGASFESVGAIPLSMIVIGFITAGLHAWRDELLLHGIVLRALGLFDPGDESGRPHDISRPPDGGPRHQEVKSRVFRVVACGVTSAGAALGRSDASARTVAVAALTGMLFGSLWVRDRGAWMPWAAHTAFRFATDTLLAGGIVQMRLVSGSWAGGDAGLFSGTAAVVALAPVALLAIASIVRRISPDSTRVG